MCSPKNKKKPACNSVRIAVRFLSVILSFLSIGLLIRSAYAQSVGAYDLINLVNGMRSANGLGALSVDANLMACAQSTAETMAAAHMTWHIGNVSGRASSFGYNNYNACFATENFMMGGPSTTIAQIQAAWSDASHMIPAQSSSYCHIGAGVATGDDGMIYYVLQAAYPAGVAGCGYAKSTGNASSGSAGSSASMVIRPVVTATPHEDGRIFHEIQEGQTLWAVSEAYHVTVDDLQSWNNLNGSTALSVGQQLYIPSSEQHGSTPTPAFELTVLPTADAQGNFFHIVKEGDTLWSISELWNVSLSSIYQANGMSAEDSIGLGWSISIPVTPTTTPIPTDTPTITPTTTPTETPIITETSAAEIVDTETVDLHTGFLHLPETGAKTYIYGGICFLILIGGAAFGIWIYWRKK